MPVVRALDRQPLPPPLRDAEAGDGAVAGDGRRRRRRAADHRRHRRSSDSRAAIDVAACPRRRVGDRRRAPARGQASGIDGIEALLAEPEVVAVGECGLDYHYDHSPRDVQREVFAAQIALAHAHDLALVIHTREAWDDTFDILAAEGVPERTVFHCFTGGPDEARRCLDLGAYLSFSGIVTFPTADDVRAAAALCPLDRLLVETDAPYLAPVPHRGERNEAGVRSARRRRCGGGSGRSGRDGGQRIVGQRHGAVPAGDVDAGRTRRFRDLLTRTQVTELLDRTASHPAAPSVRTSWSIRTRCAASLDSPTSARETPWSRSEPGWGR